MEAFQRRVATHYIAAKGALKAAAAEATRVRATVAQAKEAIAASREELIVGHRIATVKMVLPMIDPESGADRPVEVDFRDSRKVTVTATRPRPGGYLVLPDGAAAIEALKTKGVVVCQVGAMDPIDVEAFRVDAPKQALTQAERENINPEQAVKVSLEARKVAPPAGSAFVPVAQPAAAIIAATLEPDSPGSHVGTGMTRVLPSGDAPIYRVPLGTRVATAGENPRGCGG